MNGPDWVRNYNILQGKFSQYFASGALPPNRSSGEGGAGRVYKKILFFPPGDSVLGEISLTHTVKEWVPSLTKTNLWMMKIIRLHNQQLRTHMGCNMMTPFNRLLLLHMKMKKWSSPWIKIVFYRTYLTYFMTTMMISYVLGDVNGIWLVSFFIDTRFTTLRLFFKQRVMRCHHRRTIIPIWIIQVIENLMMIWAYIGLIHSRMNCCNIVMSIFGHTLGVVIHTLLWTHIFVWWIFSTTYMIKFWWTQGCGYPRVVIE